MQDEADLFSYKEYSAVDFVIGLFITLGASVVNALGLNITKLDFTRQEALPPSSRRADWKRGLWWLGLVLYVASQLVGSTLALEYLRAEYVAPLGSTSLIFNFIFAYLLVGTPVVRTDIIGTLIIVLGVIGVVLFGNARSHDDAFDKESNLSLSLLKEIWGRGDWIAYLTCLEVTTAWCFWMSAIVHEVCMGRMEDERGDAERDRDIEGMLGGGRRSAGGEGLVDRAKGAWVRVRRGHAGLRKGVKRVIEKWAQSKPDSTIRKTAGLCWSITGGLLAGQTLVFAKSAVKLVTSAINKTDINEANQFSSPLSWVIVILLIVAAVLQIYCLNASLKCYDSTFTVPLFFATYTTCGFINSLVYLDEFHTYRLWVFLCIWASIAVLIGGVALLSFKKPVARTRAPSILHEEGDDPSAAPLSPTEEKMASKQGWLGGMFGGKDAQAPGEISRSERRKRKGVQQLGEGDSVLDSERPGQGADDLELEEVERLADGKVFDADEFGDFKEAEEVERKV